MKTTVAVAILTLASSAFSLASAQIIIYADNFQYGSGYPGINGQKPTLIDTPTTTTWTGNSSYLFTNGDNTALLSTQGAQADALAFLPLNLTPNTAYTFSLTLNPTSTNSWQEMGFINIAGATATDSVFSGNIGPAVIYGPGAGPGNGSTESGIQLFNGAIGTHAIGVTTPADAKANNAQTFEFDLNTGPSLGTYMYSVTDTDSQGNVTTLASDITYSGTISGIELGSFYENGTLSDLLVTSNPIETPEPSTTCLLVVAGLALFVVQRRLRAKKI